DFAEYLIAAHQHMVGAYSTGFAKGCNVEFPNSYSVSYFLDRATFPEHYTRPVRDEELDEALSACVWRWTREELFDLWSGKPMIDVAYLGFITESYRVLGCAQVERKSASEANVRIYSINMPGSVIGRAWYTSGRCSERGLKHQIDSSYRPGLIGTCKLGCHEFGHNHGEEHQFSGQATHHSVMSYYPPRLFYGFSTGQAPHVLPRDRSIDSLIAKYGGKPNPPYSTPPVKPPVIVVPSVGGTITLTEPGKPTRTFAEVAVGGGDGPIVHS
ncbi:MAG TPA: hypothetical protein VMX74_01125, partial [Pirellulales bacterium]|nr:hypothetical protein [Pirellulales bacterium]